MLCVQRKTPDDGQRNCPKHVQFYPKNKFEKLVHLAGFIVRIYHDARSPGRQINYSVFDMFRAPKCSSSGRLVHAVLWYLFHAKIVIKVCMIGLSVKY